jgi:hypothetical protein
LQIDRASAFVLREALPVTADAASRAAWAGMPLQVLRGKPQFLQREGEALPSGLRETVRATLEGRVVSQGVTSANLAAS